MPIDPTIKQIKDIRSILLQPALTSHFLCEFSPPSGVQQFINTRIEKANFNSINYTDLNDNDLLSLSCTEASLPGSSLATVDIDNDYHGVSEKHVYRRLYDDRADFTFYVDSNYKIITFFENWISYCVNENELSEQDTKNYTYKMNYPKDYKTDNMYITKFEKDNKGETLRYRFIGAYPISINSMPVSYDASNLLKCAVSFSYTRYVIGKGAPGKTLQEEQENSGGNPTLPTQSDSVTLYNSSGKASVTRRIGDGTPTLTQLINQ